MFSRLTLAAIISAAILSSSIIYTVAQQPIDDISIQSQPIIPRFADTAEYSVKFICGTSVGNRLLNDGVYNTAINIHNPGPESVKFEWKVASHDGQISRFVDTKLGPDQAMEIDCKLIFELLNNNSTEFIKGFVVIHQPLELQFQQLDVSPVYTTSKATIVNKVWFKVIVDDCVSTTHVFNAGIEDNFMNGTEQASPSTALAAYLANYLHGTRDFDDTSNNKVFEHTFTNLPDNIIAAQLELTLRAGNEITDNDSLALDMNNDTTFNYGIPIRNLNNNQWNDNSQVSLILDLANLPPYGIASTNILDSINADHALDIYIQDDTGIDFAKLTVVACSIPDYIKELLDKDLAVIVESDKDEVIDIEDEVRSILTEDVTDISIVKIDIKDVEVGVGTGQSIDVEQVEPKFIRLG